MLILVAWEVFMPIEESGNKPIVGSQFDPIQSNSEPRKPQSNLSRVADRTSQAVNSLLNLGSAVIGQGKALVSNIISVKRPPTNESFSQNHRIPTDKMTQSVSSEIGMKSTNRVTTSEEEADWESTNKKMYMEDSEIDNLFMSPSVGDALKEIEETKVPTQKPGIPYEKRASGSLKSEIPNERPQEAVSKQDEVKPRQDPVLSEQRVEEKIQNFLNDNSKDSAFKAGDSLVNFFKENRGALEELKKENPGLLMQFGEKFKVVKNEIQQAEQLKQKEMEQKQQVRDDLKRHMDTFKSTFRDIRNPLTKERALFHAGKVSELLKNNPDLIDEFKAANPSFKQMVDQIEKSLAKDKKVEADVQNFLNSVGKSDYFVAKQATLTDFFRALDDKNYVLASDLGELLRPANFVEQNYFISNPRNHIQLTNLQLKVGVELFSEHVKNIRQPGGEVLATAAFQNIQMLILGLPVGVRQNALNDPQLRAAHKAYTDYTQNTYNASTGGPTGVNRPSAQVELRNCQAALNGFAAQVKDLAVASGKEKSFPDFQKITTVAEAMSINKMVQLQLHPDRNRGNPDASRLFQDLDNAYAELCVKLCKNLSIRYENDTDAKNSIFKEGQEKFEALQKTAAKK